MLLNLRFDDFNHLVDSTLNTERKYLEMEDKKRKIVPIASDSNTRPRLQPPQQYWPPQQYQQRPQQYQHWPPQYPPRQQQAGQCQRFLAPPAHAAPQAPPAPQAPRQEAPPAGQQAPPRACFHCGQPGHYANNCPQKAQAGQQGRPAQPKTPA